MTPRAAQWRPTRCGSVSACSTTWGLNLYSNIPAVISEVVANSWDVDATTVSIDIDKASGQITVTDNRPGMTVVDLNERFRSAEPPSRFRSGRHRARAARDGTQGDRQVSLFAIAETVRVETAKGGGTAGLVLRTADIRSEMSTDEGEDHPEALTQTEIDITEGTGICLTDLRLSRRKPRRLHCDDD